jgi:hypothetical protein
MRAANAPQNASPAPVLSTTSTFTQRSGDIEPIAITGAGGKQLDRLGLVDDEDVRADGDFATLRGFRGRIVDDGRPKRSCFRMHRGEGRCGELNGRQ